MNILMILDPLHQLLPGGEKEKLFLGEKVHFWKYLLFLVIEEPEVNKMGLKHLILKYLRMKNVA